MGEVKRQGVRNTLIVYIGTLLGAVSLLYVQPVFLSKEDLGQARLILSFASVFSSLLSFGISSVTVRYLPRLHDPSTGHRGFFGFLLLYMGITIVVGSAVLWLLSPWLGALYGTGTGIFSTYLPHVLTLSASYTLVLGFNAYCLALLRSVFPTAVNDIVLRLLFILVIAVYHFGIIGRDRFFQLFVLTYTAQAALLLGYIFLVDRPALRPDLQHINREIGLRSLLRYASIITFTSVNSVTVKYIDAVFVGSISVGQVAVYSVAAFMGLFIEVPLTASERIASPAISHALAARDMEAVKRIYYGSARGFLLFGGLAFLLVVLNARDALSLLPQGYADGSAVTIIIAFGALVNMATGINHPILVNSDRYIYGSVFMVVLLVATLVGNILLVPRLGAMGAAISSCTASVLYNALKFIFIRQHFGLQPFDRGTLGIVAVIIAVWMTMAWLPFGLPTVPAIAVRSVAIIAAYAGALHLFRLGAGGLDVIRLLRSRDR
ncbi:MAG: polysaccharide biosynthesis C-terminal domain-containing protein [Flavobacteriales bacterium]|nr:hypothetical protein [Flavobacteriales bacterium]MCC6576289.1 polysaccharide biosynthesis C-terminal domain-containing protein [Flavobacteriales bacterium]NUQ15276.1 polysaccharide biosynthesis C-terminal domain-containing protein [Flavobacteriales bacterium]